MQKELRTHNCTKRADHQQDESKLQRNNANNSSINDFRTLTSRDFSHIPMEQWDLNQVSIWLEEKTCGRVPEYTSKICFILKSVINHNAERKVRLSNSASSTRRQQNTNGSDINNISPSYPNYSSPSQNQDINKILSLLPLTAQKAKTPGQILLVLNQNHFMKIFQNQEVAKCIFNAIQQLKIDREKRKRTEQEKEQERISKKQRMNNHWLQDLSSDEEEKDIHERHQNVENIENDHFMNYYYHYNPPTNIC